MMQQHSQADWLSFGTSGGGKNDFVGGSFCMDLSLLQTTCIAYIDRCGFWQGLFFFVVVVLQVDMVVLTLPGPQYPSFKWKVPSCKTVFSKT